MKVLMINKFLYPKGGSETYIFKLGSYLEKQGHEIQYFGMDDRMRTVGNNVNAYTSSMDFHGGSKLSKLLYPIKTIYSVEARKKIRLVLENFQPDVCHLNNFNFQLTPSIILEIRKWEKKSGHKCKILYTAHDTQMVCPNHLMKNPVTGEVCTKCLGGKFQNCVKGKCIHGSTAKSIIGALEGWFWNACEVYRKIDLILAPSQFIADKLNTNPALAGRIMVLHNFVDMSERRPFVKKENYFLCYGRYSKEKGIDSLLKVIDELQDVTFVFAGDGPLKNEIIKRKNIVEKGFLHGEELAEVISKARLTVVPSECFENCPFTVMESQMYGTPVLGSDIGGIPELIRAGKTGELFEPGNVIELREKVQELWGNIEKLDDYSNNCRNIDFDTIDQYVEKLLKRLYEKENIESGSEGAF